METFSIVVIAVVVIAAVILAGVKLYSQIKLKGLRQTAIDLIAQAEETYEKGKNNEKFQAVVSGILAALPAPARIIINEKTVDLFVQSIFDSIKVALDAKAKEATEEVKEETKE